MKAYIYAPLPKEVHQLFPKDRGGDDSSVPHCTVLYVGDIEERNLQKLKDILKEETKECPAIECSFGELKSFPPGPYGTPWYVSIIADPALERLHKTIWDKLKSADIPVQHSWKEYIPHATLKYLPNSEEYTGKVPTGEFTIDAIELDVQ